MTPTAEPQCPETCAPSSTRPDLAAVARADYRAAAGDGAEAANAAVREMLLSLLAAAIITPLAEAVERADADAIRLMEIVSAVLAGDRRRS